MTKLVFAAGVLLCTCACTKKDRPATPLPPDAPKEVTTGAIIGTYVVSKVERRNGSQRSNITESWFRDYAGDCAKDDVTIFNPDESFVVLDGTVACDETTDDTGTWKLLSKTQLKIDADTAVVEALTANMLRLVSPVYSTPQGDLVLTYTRQ